MKVRNLFLPMAAALSAITGAASASPTPSTPAPRIAIAVTADGFVPGNISVQAQKPVTLVFTRKTDTTCAKSVIVEIDKSRNIERDLPLNEPVEIAVTFPRAGTLSYACSMDMVKGVVLVQ